MNLYVFIDLLILLPPLVLSFDRKISYVRQWPAVAGAVLPVGAFYIWEDIVATEKGSWSFAERWAGGMRLMGLPIGEWLFFVSVPFACLFIYACVRGYVREKRLPVPAWTFAAVAAAAFAGAWVFRDQSYTTVVLIVFGVSCLASAVLRPDLPRSRQYWIAMGFSFAAFLVVNGVLTAVPVVLYDPGAIWGLRFITIPLEDFFYNFAYLNFLFVLFRVFLDRHSASVPSAGDWNILQPRSIPQEGEYAGLGGRGSVTRPPAAYRFLEKHRGR